MASRGVAGLSDPLRAGHSTAQSKEKRLTLPLVLFAVAAVGGLTLAILRSRGKALPFGLALAHGAFAAGGLVALILAVVGAGAATPNLIKVALAVFVAAALGGFLLFSFSMRKKEIPIGVMVVHALAAVTALALLIVGVMSVT